MTIRKIFLGGNHCLFLLPFRSLELSFNAEVAHLVEHNPPKADGVAKSKFSSYTIDPRK